MRAAGGETVGGAPNRNREEKDMSHDTDTAAAIESIDALRQTTVRMATMAEHAYHCRPWIAHADTNANRCVLAARDACEAIDAMVTLLVRIGIDRETEDNLRLQSTLAQESTEEAREWKAKFHRANEAARREAHAALTGDDPRMPGRDGGGAPAHA